MQQHDEIARGERAPSREFHVDAVTVKQIRAITQLSQSKFARLLDVLYVGRDRFVRFVL